MPGSNERRVRRSDLQSSGEETSPEPELQNLFLERLSKHEEQRDNMQSYPQAESDKEDDRQEQEELEFRLFAPSSAHPEGLVSRIRVKSPEPNSELLIIQRSDSYYFAPEPNDVQKARFSYSAVAGSDVLSRSHMPWPGCQRPWRVITISASGKVLERLKKHGAASIEEDDVQRKRKRKGKKARIAIRKKIESKKDRAAREAASREEKEVLEKIKRARRNREKKLKQRERNKRKKAEAASGDLEPSHDEALEDVGVS